MAGRTAAGEGGRRTQEMNFVVENWQVNEGDFRCGIYIGYSYFGRVIGFR